MKRVLLSIVGFLIPFAASFVGRILLALGFGFVEFVGVSALIDHTVQLINQSLSDFAGSNIGNIIEWAGFMRIDVHFSIALSAIGVKVLLNSLGGPTVRRLVQKA